MATEVAPNSTGAAEEVDAAIQIDTEVPFVTYAELRSYEFWMSLIFEFLGVMLFAFIGTSVGAGAWSNFTPIIGPLANGIALAVLIYVCGSISGGHLNPAVTLSMCFCGYYPIIHTLAYVVAQILGAIFGSLLTARLLPNAAWGAPKGYQIGWEAENGPGCVGNLVAPKGPLAGDQIFGWELLMTFVLIATVWACGVAKPGHGSLTPIAVGFSLLACALAGGQWTGAQLNPARAIGPAVVFRCGKGAIGYYIGAELLAAFFAAMLFATVFGPGPLLPVSARLPIKKLLKKNTTLDEIEAKTDTISQDIKDWLYGLETKGHHIAHASKYSGK